MANETPQPKWKDIMNSRILPAFPKPWASHGSDEQFENYVKRALHHLDTLKIYPMGPYSDKDAIHEIMAGILAAKHK